MDKPTKVGDDPQKLRMVKRLIRLCVRHGLPVTFYDSGEEMEQAIRDMRSGRLLREALNAPGDAEIEFIGADEPAGPPDIWPTSEHAVMFARYAMARRAEG